MGGAGALGDTDVEGVEADDGEGGMAGGLRLAYCGDGAGSVGVLGEGEETGNGDTLGECGMGEGDSEGVDDTWLTGDTAMDGDVPRLN